MFPSVNVNETAEVSPDPCNRGTHVVASDDVAGAVENLFRQESGRLIAALTRLFGVDQMQLAEDVVQDALIRALQLWPYHGIPSQPANWILSVARNLALDVVRREKRFREKETWIADQLQSSGVGGEGCGIFSEGEIRDDQLRMMFTCCHPALTRDAQVALTLKTLCGFGVSEIAAAFLMTEAAAAKKLVRARQRLREERVAFEVPAGEVLADRLEAVLQALYLLFNEGYKASSGDELVRHDLCREAVRLLHALIQHPAGDQPQAHALLALMLFNVARLESRVSHDGRLLLLADQDRSRWDRRLVGLGVQHLALSSRGTALTEFHFEAGIAACHVTAASHSSTNWGRILELYDGLLALRPNPVVALNRAVAVARVHGARAGLVCLEPLEREPALRNYHLLPAVRGHLLETLGDRVGALAAYSEALERTTVRSEREFLAGKLSGLRSESGKENSAAAN